MIWLIVKYNPFTEEFYTRYALSESKAKQIKEEVLKEPDPFLSEYFPWADREWIFNEVVKYQKEFEKWMSSKGISKERMEEITINICIDLLLKSTCLNMINKSELN